MSAAFPTPVAATPVSPAAHRVAAEGPACPELLRALREAPRLSLYAANPGRALGLFPGFEPAVLVDRMQALLDAPPPALWAFAPELPPTAEQLQRAGQAVDDPADRAVADLFWFWSISYPQSKSDPALAALAAGDPEAAYGHWRAAEGSAVAEHNMAVLFHQAALARELEGGALDEEARAWWGAAVEHWLAALAHDDFWRRCTGRWVALGLGDGTGCPAFAGRVELARSLAAVALLAALERAHRGEFTEARWLRLQAGRLCPDAAALERAAVPVLEDERRRADELVLAAEERLTGDDTPCLPHLADFFRQLALRWRVIEAVAGPEAALLRRIGDRAIEGGLAGMAEHVRRGGNESDTLPWLLHLASWPAGAQQRRRIAEADRAATERLAAALVAAGDGPLSTHEAVLRLCTEVLVPAIEQFAWDAPVQAAYRQRVVQRLRDLARTAWRALGEFEVSAQACVLAAELLDEESSTLVVRERRQMWQQFQRAQNGALSLEYGGTKLEIDSRRICCDGREWPVAALNGLRFGVNEGLGGQGPQVAWYAGRDGVVLDALLWFDPANDGLERYRQIVEALDACVVPELVNRIVERVREGQSVVFGPSALRPDGFVFQRRPGLPASDLSVPYAQVTQQVDGGVLTIGRADDPATEMRCTLAGTWNAVAMPEVLARLAEQE